MNPDVWLIALEDVNQVAMEVVQAYVLDVLAVVMALAPMDVSKGAILGAAIHALVLVAVDVPVANTPKVLNGVRKRSDYFFLTP